jgi:uncharacterized membrane protein YphA (DoxX/SURF4 family)
MKHLPTIARVLLGLIFFLSGLFGFITRFAFPPNLPPNIDAFVKGMHASMYFLPLLKGTELTCGLLLLSNSFVPLALVVLAPIIINIFCTHLFMLPSGIPMALFIGVLESYLAFFSPYKETLRPLFRRRGA